MVYTSSEEVGSRSLARSARAFPALDVGQMSINVVYTPFSSVTNYDVMITIGIN